MGLQTKRPNDFLSRLKSKVSIVHFDEGKSDIVEAETEDRGNRWTKYKISIYKAEMDGETAYFKVEDEIGKTELQSDGGVMVEEVNQRKSPLFNMFRLMKIEKIS